MLPLVTRCDAIRGRRPPGLLLPDLRAGGAAEADGGPLRPAGGAAARRPGPRLRQGARGRQATRGHLLGQVTDLGGCFEATLPLVCAGSKQSSTNGINCKQTDKSVHQT